LRTDHELIQGCLRESKASQKELFLRYAGKMLVVCRRYARHEMEAEDILQEAFMRAFDNIHQFKSVGSFEGWLRRIVVNTALKTHRKMSFQKEKIGLEIYEEDSAEPEAYGALGAEMLLKLISELPDGYRMVFNLYAVEGFSHQEIASALGIQESTSRSQLVKARRLLQSKLHEMAKVRV
jgi:RNA polymerase sigma factor (sigma-70 family)